MIEVKLTVARLREMWRNASQNGVSPEECALAQ